MMNKLILAALAATVAALPIAAEAAPQARTTHTTVRQRPNGAVVTRTTTRYRTWRAGDRFDRRYAEGYRTLPNWQAYRLNRPARGQYWVRSGRDAILVRPNGTVVTVRTGAF